MKLSVNTLCTRVRVYMRVYRSIHVHTRRVRVQHLIRVHARTHAGIQAYHKVYRHALACWNLLKHVAVVYTCTYK